VGYHARDDCSKYNAYTIDGNPCWAWCAAFVTWVYNQAGYKMERTGGPAEMAEIFQNGHIYFQLNNNPRGYAPQAGDAFWMRADNDSGFHVGIVEYVSGSAVHTIEGNVTGDMVDQRTHQLSELYAFARW
jgi:hypothetical protein